MKVAESRLEQIGGCENFTKTRMAVETTGFFPVFIKSFKLFGTLFSVQFYRPVV